MIIQLKAKTESLGFFFALLYSHITKTIKRPKFGDIFW